MEVTPFNVHSYVTPVSPSHDRSQKGRGPRIRVLQRAASRRCCGPGRPPKVIILSR